MLFDQRKRGGGHFQTLKFDPIYTQTKFKHQETCFKHEKLFRTKILEMQVL